MRILFRNKAAAAVVALPVLMMAGQCWAQTVTDDPEIIFPGHPGAPGAPGGGASPPIVTRPPPPPPVITCCVPVPQPPGTMPPGPFEPAASPD
jgi:hypothetical protein